MEEVGTPSSAYNLHLYMPSTQSWVHHHHHLLLRTLDHSRTIVYMEADRNLVSTVVVPVIGKVTKHAARILVEVNQKCSLTLGLVQESHDQQLQREPSSILHRQTTPKKKKKKKQQQQNGSSKHSAAAAAATAGFKQGQRRKQLHMTKLEKEVGSEWAQCI
ncbi:unnamed protein product [Sphagnum jensenii]|uniref:Uncharacterized protein n=1 Tax=Sphagnum jensenii TaxID=128206 RepID=A0ABP0VKH0_9BRYO